MSSCAIKSLLWYDWMPFQVPYSQYKGNVNERNYVEQPIIIRYVCKHIQKCVHSSFFVFTSSTTLQHNSTIYTLFRCKFFRINLHNLFPIFLLLLLLYSFVLAPWVRCEWINRTVPFSAEQKINNVWTRTQCINTQLYNFSIYSWPVGTLRWAHEARKLWNIWQSLTIFRVRAHLNGESKEESVLRRVL